MIFNRIQHKNDDSCVIIVFRAVARLFETDEAGGTHDFPTGGRTSPKVYL